MIKQQQPLAPEKIRLLVRDGQISHEWFYPDAAVMSYDTEIPYARVHPVDDARVGEIRERRAKEYGHSFTGTRGTDAAMADIDYLLSLLPQLSSSERRCGDI